MIDISIILAVIQDDDERAYLEQLYLSTHKRLYWIAYKMVKNDSDSKDCVSEAYRALAQNYDRYKELDRNGQINMLVTCCQNAAIDLINRRKRLWSYESSTTDFDRDIFDSLSDCLRDAESAYIVNEETRIMLSLFCNLNARERDMLKLSEFTGKSYKQVAEIFNTTPNNVAVTIHRARLKLKSEYEKMEKLI